MKMIFYSIGIAAMATSCATFGKKDPHKDFFGNPGILAFSPVGDRRLGLLKTKIESLGCVLDEKRIREARNGEVINLLHKTDRRGDCQVVFFHLVLPGGRWALHGLDGSGNVSQWREASEKQPRAMEAVAVLVTGQSVSTTPRDFESDEPSRFVRVQVESKAGWDLIVAHALESRSTDYEASYYGPFQISIPEIKLSNHRIPMVTIRKTNKNGDKVVETLCWFEKSVN